MFRKKILATLLCLFASSAALSESLARPENQSNDWTFTAAPYIWAMNMNGAVTTGGRRARVDESFSELLQHLNFAGMLWLDGTHDKFGVFLNVIYAVLRYNTQDDIASVHAKIRYGITSGGLSYEIYKRYFNTIHSIAIAPYAGFRYTENDVQVKVNIATFSPTITNDQYWTDPIIGARFNFDISKAWSAIIAGDIGGVNASSQHSYNVQALLGYSPQSHLTDTTFYIGYRLLDQLYVTGSGRDYYNWNMKLFGPIVGVAIKF